MSGTAQAAALPWNLTGNAGTAVTDFLGPTDAKPLVFKTPAAHRTKP